jgi:hypothetical protein
MTVRGHDVYGNVWRSGLMWAWRVRRFTSDGQMIEIASGTTWTKKRAQSTVIMWQRIYMRHHGTL